MKNLEARIEELESAGNGSSATVVLCADGSTYTLPCEIYDYVLDYGRVTPDGKEIVDVLEDVPEGCDALSAALIALDHDIAAGRYNPADTISELESWRQ